VSLQSRIPISVRKPIAAQCEADQWIWCSFTCWDVVNHGKLQILHISLINKAEEVVSKSAHLTPRGRLSQYHLYLQLPMEIPEARSLHPSLWSVVHFARVVPPSPPPMLQSQTFGPSTSPQTPRLQSCGSSVRPHGNYF